MPGRCATDPMGSRLHEDDSLAVRLAPGVALFATATGVLARTRARWVRVDTKDRAAERALIEDLACGFAVRDANAPVVKALRRAELVELVPQGAVVTLAEMPERLGGIRVLVGAPDDHLLGKQLEGMVRSAELCIVAWIDEQGVAIARDDGLARGCPMCAWLSDSALARYVVPGHDVATAPRAFAEHSELRALARDALVRPPVGQVAIEAAKVWVLDRATNVSEVHEITAHPACPCAARPARSSSIARETTWEGLAAHRHGPVWPVQRASGELAARVVYRRSRTPWSASVGALGVALAGGEDAELRALAEGIERFCLLHAPPDRTGVTARELGASAWDTKTIGQLLFRSEDYSRRGFRFAPFDADEPSEWCRAIRLRDRTARWAPASLVGRASRGSRALVDATSNGYAAHRVRDVAIDRAVLELVERDALLLHWYAPISPLPRIDIDVGIPGAHALLATQDVELPVVLAIGARADGSLRCGSAADVSFDRALARAVAELRVSLGGTAGPTRVSAALDDPARRYEPDDHLLFYAGARGMAALRELVDGVRTVSASASRQQWPDHDQPRRALEHALHAAGLDAWIVDRSLPDVFGGDWHVVRAIVPGLVELSWGLPYRRLAGRRMLDRLAHGAELATMPHPIT